MQCLWRNDQDTPGPILLGRAALKRALTEARDADDDLLDFVLMPWHHRLRVQHILMNRKRLCPKGSVGHCDKRSLCCCRNGAEHVVMYGHLVSTQKVSVTDARDYSNMLI